MPLDVQGAAEGPCRTDRAVAVLRAEGNLTARLALLEETKTLPFGAVWDYYCEQQDVPVGMAWMDEVRLYEKQLAAKGR